MAQHILFVSSQYVKDNTSINDNLDSDILTPFITQAQKIYIEPILGTDLYKKLQSDVSGATVAGNYKILLDEYIQNTLAVWALHDSLPFINYKLTNKSVLTKDSDNSTAVGLEEIKFLQANIRNNAEYLSQRITDYLHANPTLFPEYFTNADIDDVRPNRTSYFSGVYLGNTGNDCDFGLGLGTELKK